MATPIEILQSIDLICPGDTVLLLNSGMTATVDYIVLSSREIKIHIKEDNSLYNEREYRKIENFNGERRTYFR